MGGDLPAVLPKLSEKQLKFCSEYVLHLNATKAAIAAGYSEKGASTQAVRMLAKARISDEIFKRLQSLKDVALTKAEDVLKELTYLAHANPKDAFHPDGTLKDISEMPEALQRTIAGIEVEEIWAGRGDDRVQIGVTKKVRFWDKNRALETLAKFHKLITDGSKNITVNNQTNNQNIVYAKVLICLPPKRNS